MMRREKIALAVFAFGVIFTAALVYAKNRHPEKWYQKIWCDEAKGRVEVVLPSRARCDCLTETHAVEVEFAKKWAEAIGQSLYYAALFDKRAGIVLIMESKKDEAYKVRLDATIGYFSLPIDVWVMGD